MKKIHFLIALCGCIFAALSLSSCEDDIDVDGTYPFTVETMPVPTRPVQGETAEIRCLPNARDVSRMPIHSALFSAGWQRYSAHG